MAQTRPGELQKIIGSGVYADLDALLKKCVAGDAESLNLLDALISGHFHQWGLALSNASQAGMVAHASQLRQLLELRAKINRELAPAAHYGAVTNNILLTGDVTTLMRILQDHPAAKAAIVAHFANQSVPKVIEHAAAD